MKKTRKTHSYNKINKKYIKKMKRKTKKNRNGYKYRQKHNNMIGGDIPELGEFIGRGTHGIIRTILSDNSQVVKIFDNRVIQKKSLCKKITEQYNSTCDELNYEYEIQKIIRDSFIKNNLEEVYNLWNDTDFNNYISSNPKIYLNLTKNNTYALPSVRINKLLSHKCIIISEHTNEIDEEYYKGIIYFCNIDEIENVYRRLVNKTNIELQQESNKIYEKFYNKFYYKNAINLIIQK